MHPTMSTSSSSLSESAGSAAPVDAHQHLHHRILHRKPSLSPVEKCFLHALLVDTDPTCNKQEEGAGGGPIIAAEGGEGPSLDEKVPLLKKSAARVLDDDILFSIPETLVKKDKHQELPQRAAAAVARSSSRGGRGVKCRPSHLQNVGLWQAHEDGVSPNKLVERGTLDLLPRPISLDKLTAGSLLDETTDRKKRKEEDDNDSTASSIASDKEVRAVPLDEHSENSSWDEETHRTHYSAWEVLKDEYAQDFGFDFSSSNHPISPESILDDDGLPESNTFKIIGTSADDRSAQPHVLSPPLMGSLMNFLPDAVANENYWLKFSLVRDGASLETFKQYARASPYTILAIETRQGQVFGSFTSQPWRNHFGFYGASPAFVWKMRYSRKSKCHSLFDQAQLESEIDVYMVTDKNALIQVCHHDALAVGGDDGDNHDEDVAAASFRHLDELERINEQNHSRATVDKGSSNKKDFGFAITLEDDLCIGTTSPSPTFSSPALCGPGDRTETFEVSNLEVWSFTPCMDEASAQRLEMSKFFIEESVHSIASSSNGRSTQQQPGSPFTSRDLQQELFYRRVGQDPDSEQRRERWQYLNMMNPTGQRGMGASPRFS